MSYNHPNGPEPAATTKTTKTTKPAMMLADTYSVRKAKFPMWAEPKLDGYRFQLIFSGSDRGRVIQRSGAEYTDRLGFIAEQIADEVNRWFPGGVAIDGEAFCESWNKTTTLVKTESEIDRSELMFWAFDMIPVDWDPDAALFQRKAWLRDIIIDAANVKLTPHTVVENEADVENVFEKFLDDNYEGVMLKDPEGVYVGKRSSAWMKYKPWASTDGKIVGFQPGTRRLEGTLGALILEMSDGSEVEVGTGFTDALRHQIWAERDERLGNWVEFKHQKDPKAVASYRFPVFLRFRTDMDEASAAS